jgi:hypothetical protein
MGIEAFAEAARRILPGWHINAIEDVEFLAPFKFYRNEARTVTVEATVCPRGQEIVADCKLIGRRSLPNQAEPQVTTHFTGRVRLSKLTPELLRMSAPPLPGGLTIEAAEIYRLYFHGPAYQVLEKAWWDGNRMIGLLAKNLSSNHRPSELPTLMEPRLIELCFQTAGLWEMGAQDRMGLPHQVQCVSSANVPDSHVRLYAVVTPDPAHGTFDAEVVDEDGRRHVHLGGYCTIAMPNAVNADQVKTLHAMLSRALVAA